MIDVLPPAARIPSLDGLRAVAILMVVVSHLSGAPGFVTLPSNVSDVLGDTGVRVFFVLSGFLITTILIAECEKFGGVHLGRFYIRRCFRIFPAFYLFLLALAAAFSAGWIVLQSDDMVKAAAYVVDYCPWNSTSNFVRHIWSLSVEEQFYLVWPVAIWALGIRRARWIAAAAIVLSPIWRIVVLHFFPVATLTLPRRFDCLTDVLATGCLLACLNRELAGSERYRAILRSRFFHLVPLIVMGAAATESHPHVYFGMADTVMNLGIALYMHRCLLYPPKFLNARAMKQIGVMSYSIYLWQQPFCCPQEGNQRLAWYFAAALTLIAASVSYFAVEIPLQRFGRRLTGSSSPRELAASVKSF